MIVIMGRRDFDALGARLLDLRLDKFRRQAAFEVDQAIAFLNRLVDALRPLVRRKLGLPRVG